MYSSGIAAARSSKTAAPSTSSKSDSATRRTWRATDGAHLVAVHDAGLDERLAEAAAVGAHERGDAVEVLVGDAAEGHQRLAQAVLRRLLAAKTSRPWSKKAILTMRPERTCRSPLLRSADELRSVSAIGLLARSVSIGRVYCARCGGPGKRRAPARGYHPGNWRRVTRRTRGGRSMKRAVIAGSGSEIAPNRRHQRACWPGSWTRATTGSASAAASRRATSSSPEVGHLRPRHRGGPAGPGARGRREGGRRPRGVRDHDARPLLSRLRRAAAGQAGPARRARASTSASSARASSTACSSRTRRSARAWPRPCCWWAPRSTRASCPGRGANWEYRYGRRTCRPRRRSSRGTRASGT